MRNRFKVVPCFWALMIIVIASPVVRSIAGNTLNKHLMRLVLVERQANLALEDEPKEPSSAESPPMHPQFDVPVRMSDGTVLAADVYVPEDAGRYPVVLIRTPYGKGSSLGNPA